jgi:hypothetical protein
MVAQATGATMKVDRFEYEGLTLQAMGSGVVIFNLRNDGGPFNIGLSVEDAQRLRDDLRSQIRIAEGNKK